MIHMQENSLMKDETKKKIISMNISSQNAVRHNLAGNKPHLLLEIILEKIPSFTELCLLF